MTRIIKTAPKKISAAGHENKARSNYMSSEDKIALKKNIIRHLIHPDYILFDWEFFSNQLEFE